MPTRPPYSLGVPHSPGEPHQLTAACLQFDVRAGDVAANCAAMRASIDEAVLAGARLCVLPELWSTSFLSQIDDAVLREADEAERELRELSAQHQLVTVGSTLCRGALGVHNTAHVYDCGAHLGSYHKIHLFSPNAEHRYLAPGDTPLVAQTSVGRIGVLICYDLRFPELARYYFHRGVEILAVPGQWPEARTQHWRTLLRARAIENEMFVLGCNRTGQEPSLRNGDLLAFPGDSRIVDPTGELLATSGGGAGALVATLELRKAASMRRILPIARDGRPQVYRQLFEETWAQACQQARRPDESG